MDTYSEEIDKIINQTDNLVITCWKDQKENIKYEDNPSYKMKVTDSLSKAQQLEKEIKNLEEEISTRENEI